MSLSEKHDATVKLVSNIFQEAGYRVEFNRPIGPSNRRQYVDIVALGPKDALIIEVKAGMKTGSSDVMAMESFVRTAMTSSQLGGKKVEGIIISQGTLDPARILSKEWGIQVIEGDTPQKIKQSLQQFLEKR